MLPILLTVLGGYALVCVLLVAFQERLVFFPSRQVGAPPPGVEDVWFRRDDGTALHGWFARGGDVAVLVCHGNAGNVTDRADLLRTLHGLGLSVLLFDYAGYGCSEGRPDEEGTYADARAARRWLLEERAFDPSRLVYFGRSLGGAVAIGLAAEEPPAALVVEATFSSLVDVGARVYPWLPVRWLSRIRYDSAGRVRALTCPKLFMHSRGDETVPFELGTRLFDAAAEPKRFVELTGGHAAGHAVDPVQYASQWRAFLSSCGLDPAG